MNTRDDSGTIRTGEGTIAIAVLVGILGAGAFGWLSFMGAGFGGSSYGLAKMVGMKWAIFGAVSGISFVGLFALLFGAKLGRYYSYPFTVCLGVLLGELSYNFLGSSGPANGRGLSVEPSCFAGIILGVVGGVVLAKCIRGYSGLSRFSAAIGTIPMLAMGSLSMGTLQIGPIGGELVLVEMLLFAVLGGVLGAVLGAIGDRLIRRSRRAGHTGEH